MDGRSFQGERITALWTEMEPLNREHYQEVHGVGGLRLDRDGYARMEAANLHLFYTARVNDELIGYCSLFLNGCPHDGLVEAHEDAIYIVPRHRGWTGAEFEHWQDTIMCAHGIARVFRERPVQPDDDLSRAMRRGPRGYRPAGVLFRRDLEAA